MTDSYDSYNPAKRKIAYGIEVGDGIPEMRNIQNAREALHSVGFEVQHDEDLADRPDVIVRAAHAMMISIRSISSKLSDVHLFASQKWYYPLEGDIRKVQTLWDVLMVARMTTLGKIVTQNVVYLGEKLGVFPKGTYDVGEALKLAADALVAGGRQKLFTPMRRLDVSILDERANLF